MNKHTAEYKELVKVSVHNVVEARALLKEWEDAGEFYGCDIRFFSHAGNYIGTVAWRYDLGRRESLV